MKTVFLLLSLVSGTAFAAVEEIELGTCFKAVAPKLVRAVPRQNCWLTRDSGHTFDGGYNMELSYSYTAVVETLIIITNDYGNVLSEKVYKKNIPRTETFTVPEGCADIDAFSEKAKSHFQVFYEGLLVNQC